MRFRYRYGILDDDNTVVRWVYDKPSADYRYIVQKIVKKPAIDWNNFEPALF